MPFSQYKHEGFSGGFSLLLVTTILSSVKFDSGTMRAYFSCRRA
jgi:hypothetical protein